MTLSESLDDFDDHDDSNYDSVIGDDDLMMTAPCGKLWIADLLLPNFLR